jgi:hypothetical protein
MRTLSTLSLIAVVAAACGNIGPSTQTCTLVGCDSAVNIAYSTPVAGAYTLDVTAPGYAGHVDCPTAGTSLQPTTSSVYAACDGNGFTLSWPGDQPLGSSHVDETPLPLAVTVRRADGSVAAKQAPASGLITTTSQPNGPSCGPTCYARSGNVTLAK